MLFCEYTLYTRFAALTEYKHARYYPIQRYIVALHRSVRSSARGSTNVYIRRSEINFRLYVKWYIGTDIYEQTTERLMTIAQKKRPP
uniref:Uncharacterized protein n=1 Tax=Trichogramma kaykai TaxID=54128 RepID=A0ABD2VZT4_9HYME